jgi:hypothetical protein
MTLVIDPMTIRTYDVYYSTKYNAVRKDEVLGRNAWAARCQVEEFNPGCKVTRVLLQSNSDW